ncbi:Galactose-specific lectin nattectin [Oryzias melastigma]|uniref:Galactose-specific lectin nattectin n=1 Tax=Oryzias melastigma TaxID=30732 RepID=A0A834BZJ3_ORYME|nr:lactose-binding lectin l-2 [Oryzias melastigma]KAF6717540.1 Galactose-specific lectin nattectin [Oryzias melastigma]
MLVLILVGLALMAVDPSDGQELKLLRGNCPPFWYSYGNRCYKYVATPMIWGDAELHCVSQGANLVSVQSNEEEAFIKTLIRNFDPAQADTWIGLSDAEKEGGWLWSDGSKITFQAWHSGQPDNYKGKEHCATTNYGTTKKWNDLPCTYKYGFVCKSREKCL